MESLFIWKKANDAFLGSLCYLEMLILKRATLCKSFSYHTAAAPKLWIAKGQKWVASRQSKPGLYIFTVNAACLRLSVW